ncbi:molybdopterin-dependent oxidoreductase [Robbsia sp. Bb-Pol-6]|uniref:Molybdopterin-dependent oxidoreductase n=1 Tax=Robbsia betulipollinis TaxID=2981849 RepID=A0ABT3ZRQ2_9BURK|nr:nitrate reductase [Robbsia betulipollinis]MCY0389228.1 molybdopterin-dependent oxidoreductase [Robbsia betulipollinis]
MTAPLALVTEIAPTVAPTAEVASTCCYCGVGCGVLIETDGRRIVGVRGDPDHPANQGRLCSKGLALADSARSARGRLLHPEMRRARALPREQVAWDAALDEVADRFAAIVAEHGPDAVAFYVSGQLLTEDYYLFNKLAKGLIGTNNIDTNSRLCMSTAVAAYKLAFGADGPPGCYEDLDHARTVLFAGSNAAWAHPVLFRRLEAARAAHPGTRWIVVDPRVTDTAAMADLHLRIQPGTDVALFNGMLHHLIWEQHVDPAFIAAHTQGFDALKQRVRDYTPRFAAEICGIAEQDLLTAAQWFGESPASLSLYCMGLNQSSHGTDKNLALINLHLASGQIGRPGAGPFSLTGQPNAMGGREVGGMATMLAAHREIGNADDRAELARLWGIDRVSDKPGLPAVAMFDAIADGRIKAVWIACTNPAHSMPDIGRVHEALETAEFVVVQDAFAGIDTAAYADVLLPAASWGEKSGTVTNSERRISRVRRAVDAPGEARADWRIVRDVARRIEARLARGRGVEKAGRSANGDGGIGGTDAVSFASRLFAHDGVEAVFDEHRLLTEGRDLDIGGLSYATLERDGPQQWPYPAHAAAGQARRYTDGVFATPDGRARFHAVDYLPVAEPITARFPFQLTTGRVRDQWHGMSRTGRVPGLATHAPEPTLTMHPGDALRRGFADGELLRIASRRGALVLPLATSADVSPGSVFAAMHWNGQMLNSGGINETTIGAVDPRAFQPELKHAAVRIERALLGWAVSLARVIGDLDHLLDLQAGLAPLLRECGYAAVSVHRVMAAAPAGAAVAGAASQTGQADAAGAGGAHPGAQRERDDGPWVLALRAAADTPRDDWLERVAVLLSLLPGPDALDYRDPRRGTLKRAVWAGARLDGFIFAGEAASIALGERLRGQLIDGAPWQGSRLAAFAPTGAQPDTPRDRVVCSCRNVRESVIRRAVANGADVPTLKHTLGCGTVCGSCVPELTRLCAARVPA